MRTLLLVAALVALPVSTAFAVDDSVLASRFGNTVVAKGTFGEVHLYFNADHTFTGKVTSIGYGLKGIWKIDGGNLCLTYDPAPPGMTNPSCAPIATHAIGDTWTANGRTVTLVQGIQ